MPSVSRTFTVTAPPAAVVDYLKDFGNAEEWDPGTVRCTRTDSGPIAVGSTWHNVSKVAGVTTELTYTLTRLDDTTIVLVGVNDRAQSTDTITVRPAGTGSELTYTADLDMKGFAKLVGPAMKVIFERIANETEKKLTGVLDALAHPDPA